MAIIERSVSISSSKDAVMIDNLLTGVEYHFQVVAVAELNGKLTMGQRSERVVIITPTSSTLNSNGVTVYCNVPIYYCIMLILVCRY